MKKVLIAVDETKGSQKIIDVFLDIFSNHGLDSVVVLYVEKLAGGPLMDEILGDPEMSELKDSLKGTPYQEALDKRATRVLDYYQASLEKNNVTGVKALTKEGHPADEIIATAEQEGVDMIIVGSRGLRKKTFFIGSVSREVSNRAAIPVLIAK